MLYQQVVGLMARLDALDRRFGNGVGRARSGSGRAERSLANGAIAFGVLVVATLLALSAWNGHRDRRIADRLGHDGVEVDAVIVDARTAYQLKGENELKVAFQAGTGQHVEIWVTVSHRYPPGPTRIRYLRTDPKVARLVDDPTPREHDFLARVIILLVMGLIGFGIFRACRGFDRLLGLHPRDQD